MTHFGSSDSISGIKWITLSNTQDLEHCSEWAVSPLIWKQRYFFMRGGFFWSRLCVLFLCCHFSESDPEISWHLGVSNTLWAEIFEIKMSFEYGLDAFLFWIMSEGLSSREKSVLQCVSPVNDFFPVMSVFSFNLE